MKKVIEKGSRQGESRIKKQCHTRLNYYATSSTLTAWQTELFIWIASCHVWLAAP